LSSTVAIRRIAPALGGREFRRRAPRSSARQAHRAIPLRQIVARAKRRRSRAVPRRRPAARRGPPVLSTMGGAGRQRRRGRRSEPREARPAGRCPCRGRWLLPHAKSQARYIASHFRGPRSREKPAHLPRPGNSTARLKRVPAEKGQSAQFDEGGRACLELESTNFQVAQVLAFSGPGAIALSQFSP